MSAEPLLVEFAGLPGSGKTTLVREVAALLKDEGVSCALLTDLIEPEFSADIKKSRLRKIWRDCVRFEGLAGIREMLSFGCRIRPIQRRSFRRLFGCLDLMRALKTGVHRARERGCAVILADQALIQYTWNSVLRVSSPDHRHFDRLFRFFGKQVGGCVCFVDIDADTAYRRIRQREALGSPLLFKGMDENRVHAMLDRSRPLLEMIVRKASTGRSAGFLKLSGRDPLESNSRRVVEVILKNLK